MEKKFSKSTYLKHEAFVKLGEQNVGMSKSSHRTKKKDKRIQNWVFILTPMPRDEFSINPKLKELMYEMYKVNTDLANGTIECTFDNWLQVFIRCEKLKIKLTVPKEEDDDSLLLQLTSEVEKEVNES